ncbi:hypothetical protein [Sinimarinibacterium sp. NLF-5-8]|uniref:hypothetical protein n=1 Tax=Sinimarinibacterium sp. NLF-5-8 TaxID=2698684 RepID=UPI00137C3628|nr:hypothetical protein [Sinimarinibacterium sp. NLF-5-8]QHS09305.1 hypothetical protein GT972_03475 [Sinimarinibacterium sp. NLF-5-8]
MRTRSLHRWLMILALALSQWLVIAHAHEHPALAVDQACAVCLHAPGVLGGALAASPAPLALPRTLATPPVRNAPQTHPAAQRNTRIRDPPLMPRSI